jgi:hypothetical protein
MGHPPSAIQPTETRCVEHGGIRRKNLPEMDERRDSYAVIFAEKPHFCERRKNGHPLQEPNRLNSLLLPINDPWPNFRATQEEVRMRRRGFDAEILRRLCRARVRFSAG